MIILSIVIVIFVEYENTAQVYSKIIHRSVCDDFFHCNVCVFYDVYL